MFQRSVISDLAAAPSAISLPYAQPSADAIAPAVLRVISRRGISRRDASSAISLSRCFNGRRRPASPRRACYSRTEGAGRGSFKSIACPNSCARPAPSPFFFQRRFFRSPTKPEKPIILRRKKAASRSAPSPKKVFPSDFFSRHTSFTEELGGRGTPPVSFPTNAGPQNQRDADINPKVPPFESS